MLFIGVDSCRKGWFAVILEKNWEWQISLYKDAKSLWQKNKRATLILIDIAVGMPGSGEKERRCDKEARKLLGKKRMSSVFPVPCREVVYAENYKKALEISRKLSKKGISKHLWNITPKIKEVDHLLRSEPLAKIKMRESHPEVCFWALNKGKAMRHPKRTEKGFEERKKVLKRYFQDTEKVVEEAHFLYKRSEVSQDDVLDALVLAVTGRKGNLVTIPKKPEIDSEGIPMEIVYSKW